MKHAYLIIAHNEPLILKTLISLIDDVRNDIYILIDKRSELIKTNIKTNYSSLFYCDRIKIYWGDYSQIQAELLLFEAAFKNGPYAYYHLLSGVCLPIKSQNYIHDFFEKNNGKEFVGFIFSDFSKEDINRKIYYYHLWVSNFLKPNLFFRLTRLQGIIFKLQVKLGIKRHNEKELQKGSNWVSVTNDFVKYLLSQKGWIKKTFRYTLCGDEIFLQSVLWNSKFRKNIYDTSDCYKSSLRFINFQGWHPKVLTMNDFERIINSECLFARKFSSKEIDIVEKLYKHITRNGIKNQKL